MANVQKIIKIGVAPRRRRPAQPRGNQQAAVSRHQKKKQI